MNISHTSFTVLLRPSLFCLMYQNKTAKSNNSFSFHISFDD